MFRIGKNYDTGKKYLVEFGRSEMERDCLSEEHQVLTEYGFMFLKELEKLSTTDRPLIAGYDPATKSIVYEPASELIIKPVKVQEMIEVTQYAESERWGDESDPYGRSKADFERDDNTNTEYFTKDNHSNGVSFVVTPNHDLYFKIENERQEIDYTKNKAQTLTKMGTIKLLSCASNGVLTPNVAELPFRDTLGLNTLEHTKLFLKLYGYWMRDSCARSLLFYPDTGLETVVFRIKNNVEWLEEVLNKLGLLSGDGYTKSDLFLVIRNPTYTRLFHREYSSANGYFSENNKWFFPCALTLNKEYARALISGLHVETKDYIYTSSIRCRDEIVRLCIHAGYVPSFNINIKYAVEKKRRTDDAIVIERLFRMETIDNLWVITYTDTNSTNATPAIYCERDVKTITYTGRTWCVTVPHGFIITRRAHEVKDITVKASMPIIMGNCMIGHGTSKFLQERLFEQSDRYAITICGKCGNFATTKSMCKSCETEQVVQVKFPYISKLVSHELGAMLIKMKITAK